MTPTPERRQVLSVYKVTIDVAILTGQEQRIEFVIAKSAQKVLESHKETPTEFGLIETINIECLGPINRIVKD
jgi:hypothetical protein